ncbi:MAG: CRTAC1 family protein, partial [Gemmatimonadales bacterium]
YPLSPSSRLYRNDGRGRFTLDSANSLVLSNIGMVSAALWSDVDQDGDSDLLLAIEWGTIKLFRNDAGRLAPATGMGFEGIYSRWLGLASGDFDGDGRPDLVSTSWGRNIRWQADSLRPLYLYFGDFDGNGSLDPLLAQDDPRLGGPAPLASFARLSRAMPGITQRLRRFQAYADATVDEVMGGVVPNTMRLGTNNFESLIWLNRGNRFEPHPLPLMAQLAPAFAPVVADFDGDGNEDLVLSQNFFPTDLETPRYDAGRSLLLLGDGQGGFRPIPSQLSGLLVYGDQRGAASADYDGDGRADLVITQNGTATRLFRNQGGRPGLRVRLEGGPGNPHAVGAALRVRFGQRSAPVREIQAGSGHWSVNGATQALGLPGTPTALWIRWPDGKESEIALPPEARAGEISVGPDGRLVTRPAVAPRGRLP